MVVIIRAPIARENAGSIMHMPWLAAAGAVKWWKVYGMRRGSVPAAPGAPSSLCLGERCARAMDGAWRGALFGAVDEVHEHLARPLAARPGAHALGPRGNGLGAVARVQCLPWRSLGCIHGKSRDPPSPRLACVSTRPENRACQSANRCGAGCRRPSSHERRTAANHSSRDTPAQ